MGKTTLTIIAALGLLACAALPAWADSYGIVSEVSGSEFLVTADGHMRATGEVIHDEFKLADKYIGKPHDDDYQQDSLKAVRTSDGKQVEWKREQNAQNSVNRAFLLKPDFTLDVTTVAGNQPIRPSGKN